MKPVESENVLRSVVLESLDPVADRFRSSPRERLVVDSRRFVKRAVRQILGRLLSRYHLLKSATDFALAIALRSVVFSLNSH